jgi:DnaJ-class molecular chaperone
MRRKMRKRNGRLSMSTQAVLSILCKHPHIGESKVEKYGVDVFERRCLSCGKELDPQMMCQKCSGAGKEDQYMHKETGFREETCSRCQGTGRQPYNEMPKEWER